ncbi:related to FMO1 Flavin-containing monooxygenase [Cephalotrichum gorgonifer]|uniref:Related to FMO1 Flavin-containing monooxygenase n=1 Tax=Cephalotrichum gorgonifer TaxID=2041049 RepID=A0AAE8MNI5_9PEZI|nr:related to FMO1 Flavin-containing monooxygenase [Cephalotrichum gorgonifer]
MSKTVCIIGAGPAGIVAAKTLALHHTNITSAPAPLFAVTVYDSNLSPGGLWPSSRSDPTRPIHPGMTANLTTNTVQFSDLAWEEHAPQFPRAWMVGSYLTRYVQKYLDGRENVEMRFGRRVVRAERGEGGRGWVVESEGVGEGGEGSESREYDFLVVASGYFGKKKVPEWAGGALLSSAGQTIPVVHSTEFRTLNGLLGDQSLPGKKILVVGGQMSGVEIASTIASELSSAAHSPGAKPIRDAKDYTVHHLSDRHTWVTPLFTTPTPTAKIPYFLPSDFNAFNIARRPQPLTNIRGGLVPESLARVGHESMKTSMGTDQAEFHPVMADHDPSAPLYVAISQFYPNLVRSGLITLSRGRLESPEEIPAKTGVESVDDIAAVVLATGFDPSPSLSFLPVDVLEKIGHAPEFPDLTPALASHGTHHPSVPDLGFVGFYRGPYWGVMEMQSRFLAHLWTPEAISPRSDALKTALERDRSSEEVLAMRGNPRTAQFPMGDYPYLMQEFASALSLDISPAHPPHPAPAPPVDLITPARYSYPNAAEPSSAEETEKSLRQTRKCADECLTSTGCLAASVFRNLLGTWTLNREIKSSLPSHPSGTFTGTATFLLRRKTADGIETAAAGEQAFDGAREGWEYLYIEEGIFASSVGFSFPATRRYVYRYDEVRDVLSLWFVRVNDDEKADYLFHEVEFLPRPDSEAKSGSGSGVRAKAGHLCIDDYYAVEYDFGLEGVGMKRWEVRYVVKGPKKEYTLHGVYTRP